MTALSQAIVFGRSPFINEVDVPRLLKRYPTIGLNHFGQQYPVDYLFSFDGPILPNKSAGHFAPYYYSGAGVTPYSPKCSDGPILEYKAENNALCLGFKYFTVSCAINWALLAAFSTIYLIGVDHVESDTTLQNNDGTVSEAIITPDAHRGLKQFIYHCAAHARIYQCNPAVRDGWELPYKDLSELYGQA